MAITYVPSTGEYLSRKELTFTGAAPAATDLFTVTGDIHVRIIAVCTTLIGAGAANGEVGIAGATDTIIASTLMSDIDAGEIWHDATPDAEIELDTVEKGFYITNSNDIILTPDAAIPSGVIEFYCFWYALSDGALVEAS